MNDDNLIFGCILLVYLVILGTLIYFSKNRKKTFLLNAAAHLIYWVILLIRYWGSQGWDKLEFHIILVACIVVHAMVNLILLIYRGILRRRMK